MARNKDGPKTTIPDEDFDRQFEQATARGERARAAGHLGQSVSYDKAHRRFLVELTNGVLVGIPVASLPEIAGATDAVLSEVTLLGPGTLHLETLDVDYSIPALLARALGRVAAAKALARLAGQVTSPAKAAAAKANGAKGGRPRKHPLKAGRVTSMRFLDDIPEPRESRKQTKKPAAKRRA